MKTPVLAAIALLVTTASAQAGWRRISGAGCEWSSGSNGATPPKDGQVSSPALRQSHSIYVCPVYDDTNFNTHTAYLANLSGWAKGDPGLHQVYARVCSQEHIGGQFPVTHCSAQKTIGGGGWGDYEISFSPYDLTQGWNYSSRSVFSYFLIRLFGSWTTSHQDWVSTFRGAYMETHQ